jgi:hypothetical protein
MPALREGSRAALSMSRETTGQSLPVLHGGAHQCHLSGDENHAVQGIAGGIADIDSARSKSHTDGSRTKPRQHHNPAAGPPDGLVVLIHETPLIAGVSIRLHCTRARAAVLASPPQGCATRSNHCSGRAEAAAFPTDVLRRRRCFLGALQLWTGCLIGNIDQQPRSGHPCRRVAALLAAWISAMRECFPGLKWQFSGSRKLPRAAGAELFLVCRLTPCSIAMPQATGPISVRTIGPPTTRQPSPVMGASSPATPPPSTARSGSSPTTSGGRARDPLRR